MCARIGDDIPSSPPIRVGAVVIGRLVILILDDCLLSQACAFVLDHFQIVMEATSLMWSFVALLKEGNN